MRSGAIDERLLVPRADQVAGQGVIILGGDRVEFVIVAAGAGERQAQKRLREDVDLVVDPSHLLFADVDGRMGSLAQRDETRARSPTR